MRLRVMPLFLMCCTGGSVHAEEFTVHGFGAKSCGNFAIEYKKYPEVTEGVYFAWAQGFMSGANITEMASNRPSRDLNSKSVSDQQSFLRIYCNDHPLADFWRAVMALYASLAISKKQP
jgi:hypothetical protein